MNTFFRICVYYCLGLMVFTLLFNLVALTGAFDTNVDSGTSIGDTDEALGNLSNLATPNMAYIFTIVATGVGVGIAVGYITSSIVPVGIGIFGSVFWSSYVTMHGILAIGGYIPGEILTIVTIGTVLVFVGAIIGMITGSG